MDLFSQLLAHKSVSVVTENCISDSLLLMKINDPTAAKMNDPTAACR